MDPRKSNPVILALGVLVIGGVCFAVYLDYKDKTSPKNTSSQSGSSGKGSKKTVYVWQAEKLAGTYQKFDSSVTGTLKGKKVVVRGTIQRVGSVPSLKDTVYVFLKGAERFGVHPPLPIIFVVGGDFPMPIGVGGVVTFQGTMLGKESLASGRGVYLNDTENVN